MTKLEKIAIIAMLVSVHMVTGNIHPAPVIGGIFCFLIAAAAFVFSEDIDNEQKAAR